MQDEDATELNNPAHYFIATLTGVACLLVMAIGCETLLSAALAKEPNVHCTILTSGGDINLGGLKIYISSQGLKVLALNGKSYIVASAPSWRVVQFNPNNNLGMTWTFKEWMAHSPHYTIFYPDENGDAFVWKQTRTEPTKVFGKDCTKARMHRHSKSGNSNEHEYIFIPDQTVSARACNILEKLLNVPTVHGIPVSFRTTSPGPRTTGGHQLLMTSKLEEGDMPAKFFSYPTGFKTAKREADIVSDGTTNRLIEETFGY